MREREGLIWLSGMSLRVRIIQNGFAGSVFSACWSPRHVKLGLSKGVDTARPINELLLPFPLWNFIGAPSADLSHRITSGHFDVTVPLFVPPLVSAKPCSLPFKVNVAKEGGAEITE